MQSIPGDGNSFTRQHHSWIQQTLAEFRVNETKHSGYFEPGAQYALSKHTHNHPCVISFDNRSRSESSALGLNFLRSAF